jgi:hypothetical protein
MAKSTGKQSRFGKSAAIAAAEWNFPLGKKNFVLLGAGALTIALGYALMSTGISEDPTKWNNPLAVSVAPLLLSIGYCVLIPMGLMARDKSTVDQSA